MTNDMEQERRYNQQAILEEIKATVDATQKEVSTLRVDVADRVGRLEQDNTNLSKTVSGLSIVVSKHNESISWIKGAGAASVVILMGMIIWILNHLVFKP